MKMVQIKFSHWFWITLASGLNNQLTVWLLRACVNTTCLLGILHCELTNSISTEENTEVFPLAIHKSSIREHYFQELSLVRKGQSFDSYKTSEKEDGFFLQRLTPTEEEELATRKSVSVSHVRVEVSGVRDLVT